ncbi:MAG: dehydrogenase [Moraxellaceae bacterium]|nr:MAG: dehydrogenase [Moraxellaceae bacterium]
MEQKSVLCASCDISCSLTAHVDKGRVVKISASRNPLLKDNICMKGVYAPKSFANPNRVLKPLKRVGERGSGKWEEVSWDDAMADIAKRLGKVVDEYGAEALAVSTSEWNTSVENGAGRRFMNHLGSPNWISGVALCAGNTSAVNRMVYGWYPFSDFATTQCILLFGHSPTRHSWTPIYNMIQTAKVRGAKIIVCDPRKSANAEMADHWLPLKVGSDAALMLGMVNVIINENLYDKKFIENWTVGFEALKERVNEYPLERVAELTGLDEESIRSAARTYALAKSAIIPWTPITDQQRNSTSAIRLQCTLRALTGNIDTPGGDVFFEFPPEIVNASAMEMHEVLPQEQKDKQLGSDKHPVFTYRGMEPLKEATKRVWGQPYTNLVTGNYMANPSATFRAMAGEGPYPVKAFFVLGNNTLLSFANMKLIHKGMMNQDLIVVHEHFKTPTAQLADYILPGDSWLERPQIWEGFGWAGVLSTSQKAMEPPGECRSVYAFWRDLAVRMGFEEAFPWETLEDVLDYRLHKTGKSFKQFSEEFEYKLPNLRFRKYEKTGFATPSGKVELYSSVLEGFGFDPLPYFREDPTPDAKFSSKLFTGLRENEFFQTGGRHVPELRKRTPEPLTFINQHEANKWGVRTGEWVEVETKIGSIKMKVEIKEEMPNELVRIPHGWWKPEMEQGIGKLSGAWQFSDAQACPDDDDFLDLEQGIPHLKGIPCCINKIKVNEKELNAG